MQCPHCQQNMQDAAHLAGQVAACPRCGKHFTVGSEPFDPYYTWLGIPPSEQPPNHYRLLGVQLFEPNRAVIENAADRQMKHLQSFKIGAKAVLSQRLLNEVSAARVQLLDPSRKTQYDQGLKVQLVPPASSVTLPQLPEAGQAFAPSPIQSGPVAPVDRSGVRRGGRRNETTSLLSNILIVVGGFAGVAMGGLIIFYLTGQDLLGLSGKLKQPEPHAGIKLDPRPSFPPHKSPQSDPIDVPVKTDEVVIPPSVPVKKSRPRPVELPEAPSVSPAAEPQLPPPAPEPVVPSPSVGVFEQTPKFLRLPPLSTSTIVPLLTLSRQPTEPLSLALFTEAANFPANTGLRMRVDSGAGTWIIEQTNEATGSGLATAVARLQLDGSSVGFAWSSPPADNDVRRQLANCVLQVIVGGEFRALQLREPLAAGAIALEMDRERQSVELEVLDTPASSKLFVQIKELAGFPRGGRLHSEGDTFPISKAVEIEFPEMKGPEIEMRFVRLASGKIAMQLKPTFVEAANRNYPLTIPSLQKITDAQQKNAVRAQTILNNASTQMTVAQGSLQRLQASNPSTIEEQNQARQQIAAARATISRLSSIIAEANDDLVRAQARLSAVPDIRSFLDSMHRTAQIKYTIFARAGAHEILLVDGAGP